MMKVIVTFKVKWLGTFKEHLSNFLLESWEQQAAKMKKFSEWK